MRNNIMLKSLTFLSFLIVVGSAHGSDKPVYSCPKASEFKLGEFKGTHFWIAEAPGAEGQYSIEELTPYGKIVAIEPTDHPEMKVEKMSRGGAKVKCTYNIKIANPVAEVTGIYSH